MTQWKTTTEAREMMVRVATGTVPEGYFGGLRVVTWLFDRATGDTFKDWGAGICRDHIPPASTPEESLWLLQNHPAARDYDVFETPRKPQDPNAPDAWKKRARVHCKGGHEWHELYDAGCGRCGAPDSIR